MNLHFHSDQREKISKSVGNMHVDVNMKRLIIHKKKLPLSMIQSFFWETIILYTVHFQI